MFMNSGTDLVYIGGDKHTRNLAPKLNCQWTISVAACELDN